MKSLSQFLQSGDWKGEKHVPVIHIPQKQKQEKILKLKF